ncbi:MAG: AAA family ATPase [Myxococcales bacterium]|nr:AAA family ATPase [Myxococcales bacterium]
MAVVIAFCNLKGGSGKTTLAVNVAAALHRAGQRILLVDGDTQGSATAWAARAAERGKDGPPCIAVAAAALRRDLPRLAEGYDVAIVDGPARLGAETRAAMLVADLVVVPMAPGALDLWAAAETVRVLEDARGLRPELRARALLNRADRTALSRLAGTAIAELGIEPLDVSVGARVAFGEAMLAGQGVCEYAPSSDAALEVRRLTKALLAAMTDEKGEKAA